MKIIDFAMLSVLVNMWFLHGLDVEYYTIRNDYLFDINLFLAVMTNVVIYIVLMVISDERIKPIKSYNN